MNARTALPLAILTLLLVARLQSHASEANPTATLPDNEAQAKARAALYAQEPAPVATAPTPGATTPTPAETNPAATASQPVISSAPAAVITSGPQPDNEDQARARAALREGDTSRGTQPGAVTSPVARTQPDPSTPVWSESATETKFTAPGTTSQQNPWTTGMEAPALPITAAQQQQLDRLLQQYRADSISASEYHTRRAQIIANK